MQSLKNNRIEVLIFCFLCLGVIYPRLGLFFSLILLLVLDKMSKKTYLMLNVVFSLGMAFLAYSFVKLDGEGDVSRYEVSFYNLASSLDYVNYEILSYNWYYYSWTLLELFVIKFLGGFKWVNFISIYVIYFSLLNVVRMCELYFKSSSLRKAFIIKLLLVFSTVVLFSSYKNMLAFSLVIYGISILIFRKTNPIYAYIMFFIAIGFHFSAIVPVFLFLVSPKSNFFNINLNLTLLVGLFSKRILSYFALFFLMIPFFGEKVSYYLFGEWSMYRFHSRGENLMIIQLCVYVLFLLYSVNKMRGFRFIKSRTYDSFFYLYVVFSFLFISYRTIAIRYLWYGMVLLIPQFSLWYSIQRKNRNSLLWFVLFWSFFDLRFVSQIFNTSFRISGGFPSLLFDNIFNLL